VTDDLLTIGRFARAAGLSVDTLRHWDAEGLLRPAQIDPDTGYRRYRPDQTAEARAIAALRDLELSIPAVRALLAADGPHERAAILGREKTRLEARTARLQRALHRLSMAALASAAAPRTEVAPLPRPDPSSAADDRPTPADRSSPVDEEVHVSTPKKPPALDAATQRSLGAGLYNRTWDLLEVEQRTPEQDDEMVDTAHASAYHWLAVGHTGNRARSHWLLSRVYAVLGRGEPSLHHARRAIAVLEAGGEGIEDWDYPAAAEAMARACTVAGALAEAAEWKVRAADAAQGIAGEEDRRQIESDLATLPV
jgi:DNA-binding transcriptional MerR regulator